MNKKLIFACIALANVLFSIIPFFTGPNINNLLNNVSNKNWRSANCKYQMMKSLVIQKKKIYV